MESKSKVGNLTTEEWGACEVKLRCSLIQGGLLTPDEMTRMEPIDLNRYYSKLERAMWDALDDHRKTKWTPKNESPLRTFLLTRAAHPRMDELLAVMEHGLPKVADRIINAMSADGWRSFFLGSVNRSNTISIVHISGQGGPWQ